MTMNDTTRVVINLDLPGPKASRHIYGQFAEHLGRCVYDGIWVGEDSPIPNTKGIRCDVVEALKKLRVPNVRWPGGCFADEYHWRDGTGPRPSRPHTVNSSWGDVVEDNSFGTHEFMAFAELIGADAYINGNVVTEGVREMGEWVEYLTRTEGPLAVARSSHGREQPWRVPFWGFGHEPLGDGAMKAGYYAGLARHYAKRILDHDGNNVFRIAAGANADDYEWTDTLMGSLDHLYDDQPVGPWQGISLHYYTTAGTWEAKGDATDFNSDAYWRTMRNAWRIEELLTRHATVMDYHDPLRKVALVVDEWGTWWEPTAGTNPAFLSQQNTIRDALVAAIHFAAFHRHADRVRMANIAQIVNVLQAPIQIDPATSALILTPTYHIFAMTTAHQDAATLQTHVTNEPTMQVEGADIPTLVTSATARGNTALVSLANLDIETDLPVFLDLRGRDVTSHQADVLTGPSINACNTTADPHQVRPVVLDGVQRCRQVMSLTLPAHSFVTVSLDLV
jgi:alpha-N-arabinofuranosidase